MNAASLASAALAAFAVLIAGCDARYDDRMIVARPDFPCDLAKSGGEIVPGGWSEGISGAEAEEAQAFALAELYRRFPTRALVADVHAESQVVAGMNYHFVVAMSGSPGYRRVYDIVVYRDLEGEMSVTSLEQACTF